MVVVIFKIFINRENTWFVIFCGHFSRSCNNLAIDSQGKSQSPLLEVFP